MERTVEVDVAYGGLRADCAEGSGVCVGDVDLRDGSRIFVLENEVASAGEGTALGKDIDVGIGRDDFKLQLVLILLVLALVLRLDLPSVFGVDIDIQDVGIVVEPDPTA